jgi:hypothetical protein
MSVRAISLIGGLLLLLLLIGWMSFAGNIIKRDLTNKYPPPEKMVDVGDYRLHINCQGGANESTPTVVMEAAEFSLSWPSVQPEVAKFTRVYTYDRAGLGWSGMSTGIRNLSNPCIFCHCTKKRNSF